jgi:hypothetical protein
LTKKITTKAPRTAWDQALLFLVPWCLGGENLFSWIDYANPEGIGTA